MKVLALATVAVLATAGLASASCTSEWSIEPGLSHDDYGLTTSLNFVFSFGGSAKAECLSEMAIKRNQEIENEYARLELCLLAEEAGSPRLIAECRAEGFLQ